MHTTLTWTLKFEDEEQGPERDLFFEMKFVLRYE